MKCGGLPVVVKIPVIHMKLEKFFFPFFTAETFQFRSEEETPFGTTFRRIHAHHQDPPLFSGLLEEQIAILITAAFPLAAAIIF